MSFPDPAAEVHMALTELRRSPLVEQAIDRLREQVTSGAWPVGTRLPSEAALAAELGVGRSTIREAIRALASTGMVESRQGAGTFVRAAAAAEVGLETRLRRAALFDVFADRDLQLDANPAHLQLAAAIRAADPEAAAAATSAHLDATIRTLQALLDDPGQAAR